MPDLFVPENKKDSNPKIISAIPSTHIRHLTSFYEKPLGVSFENQEDDEVILLFLRRHFITNLSWIFFGIILIIIPILFFSFNIQALFLNSSAINIPIRFITVFIIFYYLIVFNYLFVNFITWYFNISLVTNKRIVDIDFSDLVYHDVAITKLNLVEDVNYIQSGFIRSLFNYGDVFVQTAGEKPNFDFLAIPQPEKAVNIIQDLIGGPR